jgi:histidinol-phosphate aminotransferase
VSRGVEAPLAEVTERFEARYQGSPGTPGLWERETLLVTREVLERLAARLPLAIVTGRPRGDAERFLAAQGVAELFRVVVTREDAALKPDPEPVRVALEGLGVENAWLLGDTPDDLRAARGAGVLALGVCGSSEACRSALVGAGAARVFRAASELEEVL